MTATIDRRIAARLRVLTQEVKNAMTNHSDYSPRSPVQPAPERLDPHSLDALRSLLRTHGMRRIAAALADLAAQDAAAQHCACPPCERAALASRKNSGIMQSIAVTLYD